MEIRRAATVAVALVLAVPAFLAAQSVPTEVVVRAVAHDAKIIGSGVGGARITIRDVETGQILAQGVQEGETGDTDLIMREPPERGATVYDTPGAAAFRATLELTGPTRVEISARGPLDTPHSEQRAAKTLLLFPGEDVTGEGVILELHGYKVRLQDPGGADPLAAGESARVVANVEMMCGCPITPGGLWDADRVEVRARLVRDGETVTSATLSYAGETSTFGGELRAPPTPGTYELVVTASDPGRANFGMARRAVFVEGDGAGSPGGR